MKKALVLMSGGMDSTLCAAIAKSQDYELTGIHLNYGQKTQEREERAFNEICQYYSISEKVTVDVSYFSQFGGSSLTDEKLDVPKAELDSDKIPNSYVPFRNGNILAIAASYAEVIGAEALFLGAVQSDSSGYPDCRTEFIKAMEKAINLGTKPETNIKIIAPLVDMTKADIIKKSFELDSPLHLTWSCYQGSHKACGVCDSCALRLRGFKQAGFDDPIEYQ